MLQRRPPKTPVSVYWYDTRIKKWHRSGVATTDRAGGYIWRQPVGYAASFVFHTTLRGTPGRAGVVASPPVGVRVIQSGIFQHKLPYRIDAVQNLAVSGSVYPRRGGVAVVVQVRGADGRYHTTTTTRSDATGTYRASLAYGRGHLVTQSVRSAYRTSNRPHWLIGAAGSVQRIKVLNAVVTRTTATEVAKTYRSGCPVGPFRLGTIAMNYYGFDRLMHRGVLIVRRDLTGRIVRGFGAALAAGYPIAKMRNPDDYGGNDPRQMAADNTSGFNCRKVVGNPYAQSPHSYGIAIDVNTVQNPYRDRSGKWWPANGRAYRDRTPLRRGMLGPHSTLTVRLRSEGYFWGGRWNPGRDYQHFEYRG